jgi:hypothetical protein
MGGSKSKLGERPRELRRRVVLPARLRSGAQWTDTCILNISSRGLLIHSGRVAPQGSQVELRRGDHLIVARVMWRDGARVGLQADERVPIEEIMSINPSQAFRDTATKDVPVDRRSRPRPVTCDARLRGRAMEFAAVGAITVSLAVSIWAMAGQAFAKPLAQAAAALGG